MANHNHAQCFPVFAVTVIWSVLINAGCAVGFSFLLWSRKLHCSTFTWSCPYVCPARL